MTLDKARTVRMELLLEDGTTKVLKAKDCFVDKEVIDLMFMSKKALLEFYERNGRLPRSRYLIFIARKSHDDEKSLHPIVFGHVVRTYYKDAFQKHGALFDELGINVNNGMASLYEKIKELPTSTRRD